MSETADITLVPLPELKKEYDRLMTEYNAVTKRIGDQVNIIMVEVNRRHLETMREALTHKGKDHGTVTDSIEGVPLKMEVRQTVKWDGAKLKEAFKQIPPEQAQLLFKVDLSVPEKMFNGCTDPAIKALLVDARTITFSTPKIVFGEEK